MCDLAGSGVSGALTLLRRGRNSYQVVLRGMPLYTYVGDSRRSDVNGEGIRSFGGVWHTVPASTRMPLTSAFEASALASSSVWQAVKSHSMSS